MEIRLKSPWHKINDTQTFATGHFVVKKWEVRLMFKSDILERNNNQEKIEQGEPFISHLINDPRISFQFKPLKDEEKFIMTGNASGIPGNEINDKLHFQIKRILVENRLVKSSFP